MSDNQNKYRAYKEAIEAAETTEEKNRIAKEAMKEFADDGHSVPVDAIEAAIALATTSVRAVLDSIIATADAMGSEHVPVGFLKALKAEVPSFMSQNIFAATDELGVPVNYGAPDDLTGLEEL